VLAPSAVALARARRAWLDAREPYGRSEVFRFYGGPIDAPDTGLEGQLNAWPVEEQFIDYVEGRPAAGIINAPAIPLDRQHLLALHRGHSGWPGDRDGQFAALAPAAGPAIVTGYHAIEFLLWGQDGDPAGPGTRPWQDYLPGAGATAPNGARRGLYLRSAAELLVSDLATLVAAWAPERDNYRREFASAPVEQSLRAMFTGIHTMAVSELAGERMDVALHGGDPEDAQSGFSDSTSADLRMNARGVEDVYRGDQAGGAGPGLGALVRARDAALHREIEEGLDAALAALAALGPSFEQRLASDAGRLQIDRAVTALRGLGAQLARAGAALELEPFAALPVRGAP
jgi:putative iron-regulated protein